MRIKKKIEEIISKKLFALIFFSIAAYFLIFSKYGLIEIIRLRIHIHQINKKKQILRAKELVLTREIKLLQSDPNYIRRIRKEGIDE